jgi:photosystem II stability/assembly factor-like uncharacterized protein
VLALLREHLSNPEIAERLGISRDGVKFHVSEILTKLGVSSREEAATWQPRAEGRWWALAPLAALWRRSGWLLSGGVIVAALAALGLLAFLLAWGHDSSPARSGAKQTPTLAPVGGPIRSTRSMQLVAPDEGWALTEERLAWTGDGGETWSDITPAGTTPEKLLGVFFLDAQHGWTATVRAAQGGLPDPSTVTVFRTGDGGRAWEENTFAGPPLVEDQAPPALFGNFQFVDEMHGWFFGTYRTGNLGSAKLFRTTDGGRTWTAFPSPYACFQYAAWFSSTQDGWWGQDCGAVAPLYVTHDGGKSWESHELASPLDCSPVGVSYGAPQLRQSSSGLVVARWSCDGGTTTTSFYFTEDGGGSWRLAATRDVPNDIAALDADTWFDMRGDNFFVTNDAGKHWTHVTPDWSSFSTQFGSTIELVSVDFASETYGWARAQRQPGAKMAGDNPLLVTSDGGKTWEQLSP